MPKIANPLGNLTFIQNVTHIPFNIARTYWIYDVPGGEVRDGHAFRRATELIVALSGSFDVVTDDALGNRVVHRLSHPSRALLVPPMTWREINNFATNSVALVLSSTPYDPADYIYSLEELKETKTRACAEIENIENFENLENLEVKEEVDNHAISSVDRCRVMKLEVHQQLLGALTVVDNVDAPFTVKRVFYTYDIPGHVVRGGHSHHNVHQLIVAAGGSFDVTADDGCQRRTFRLNHAYEGLHVPPGIWLTLDNFSSGSVILVLTSEPYDEDDYVRDYDRFLSLTSSKLTK